jgi:hypothetical protein
VNGLFRAARGCDCSSLQAREQPRKPIGRHCSKTALLVTLIAITLMSHVRCDIRLPLSWNWIEAVRRAVGEELRDCDSSLREAAVMVASELAENVVKYGEPVPGHDSGRIQVSTDDNVLRIVSTNGVLSPERVHKLSAQLTALRESDDPEALYVDRMRDVLEAPAHSDTRLGLHRIVCEGKFMLSESYTNGILTITAERSL